VQSAAHRSLGQEHARGDLAQGTSASVLGEDSQLRLRQGRGRVASARCQLCHVTRSILRAPAVGARPARNATPPAHGSRRE
jgi:hypothetical protein